MKILITNNQLLNYQGSEIFTYELSKNLKGRGHDVYVFSLTPGKVSDSISKLGIIVSSDLEEFKKINFDIIHAQHNTTATLVRKIFHITPMVFMSHGILPELEQPPSAELGISKYFAVSEEVSLHLQNNYSISVNKVEIIRNFVDLERFYPKNTVKNKPEKLLVLSNHYNPEVKGIIDSSCKDLGIEVMHVGLPENPVKNVEDYINQADIVVTLGRGVLEAVACERNVIIFDEHGGDGFLDENNFFEIRKNNFSGRRFRKKYKIDEFKKEIEKYNPNTGRKLKSILLKENTSDKIVDKLEKEYMKIIANNTSVISEFTIINKLKDIIQRKDQEINNINQRVRQKDQEIQNKDQEIQKKEQEINFMKSSKFWKLRKQYLDLKNLFIGSDR